MRLSPIVSALALFSLSACEDNRTHPVPLPPYQAAAQQGFCLPNLDGRIDAHELEAAVGIPAQFRISPAGMARPVDLQGSLDNQGVRVWDWSAAAPGEQKAAFAAQALQGAWFAPSFPGGQFTVPLDPGGRTLAVYRKDAEAFWLLGLASAEPNPPEGRTLMAYDQQLALYRFPIQPGAKWTAQGKVQKGLFRGLPYIGVDIYETEVDALGTLHLPDLSLTQVQRVRTRVQVQPAVGKSTSRRQVSFLFECLGEVARAVSQEDETKADFTTASEVRRLGL